MTNSLLHDTAWCAGYDFAKTTLADETPENLAAIAKQFTLDLARLPYDSEQANATRGALTYISGRY